MTAIAVATLVLCVSCASIPANSEPVPDDQVQPPATLAAPAAGCAVPYDWCGLTTPTAAGPASAPVLDTGFNPDGGSYSYLAQGSSLIAVRNLADDSGDSGSVAWVWQTPGQAPLLRAPAVVLLSSGEEVVFVAGGDGSLYKVQASTGKLLATRDTRRCPPGPCVEPSSLVCSDDSLVGSPTVQLYDGGAPRFRSSADAAEHPRDDLVFIQTANECGDATHNRIMALWASDLSPRWIFNDNASNDAGPPHLVGRGAEACALAATLETVFCASDVGSDTSRPSLWALDSVTGAVRWSSSAGSISGRPAIVGRRLYVAAEDGTVSAFDLEADASQSLVGHRFWRLSVDATFEWNLSAFQDSGGRATLVLTDPRTLLVIRDNGPDAAVVVRASPPEGAAFASAPAALESLNKIYVGLDDGTLRQFDLDGSLEGSADVNRVATFDRAPVFQPSFDLQLTDQRQLLVSAVAKTLEKRQIAQVTTADLSGLLAEVRLPVFCSGSDFTIEIQGVTNGVPSNVVLATQTVAGATVPPFDDGPVLRSFSLSNPVFVVAGDEHAIVLSSDGDCKIHLGPAGSYPGGAAFVGAPDSPGSWVQIEGGVELAFETGGFPRLVVAAGGIDGGIGRVTRLILPLLSGPPAS